jgi:ribosome-binding factor A
LKQYRRRFREVEFVDSEFVEALCEDDSGNRSSNRQVQRKTQQFCRQVQRALNLALEDSDAGGGLSGLFIEDVSPAPDCGRLLAYVVIPAGLSIADAIATLQREGPHLRAEVARAITRKRAPELAFVPALLDGGGDE